MRAVIQRVRHASVHSGGECTGAIGAGLLVFIGVEEGEGTEDLEWLCNKIAGLRIFPDEAGVMNRSLLETGGGLLLVSQFTLHASTKRGARPSYIRAARGPQAEPVYEAAVKRLSELTGRPVATGRFGADMQVELLNDGPVTILIDTKNKE